MIRTQLWCAKLAVVVCSIALASELHAAPRSWDGGGTPVVGNFLWSDAFNWDGDATSPVGSDSLTFGGTLGTPQLNDLLADTTFSGITYNSGTSTFAIAGNRITLGGDIVDNATTAQALNTDFILSDNRAIRVVAGGTGQLSMGGIISDGGGAKGLTLINNAIGKLQVGNGGVFSFGGLTLSGANTFTGPTKIQTGNLTLDFAAASAPASDIISSNSALTLGTTSVTTTPGASALNMVGKAATANTQTFAGTTVAVGYNTIRASDGGSGGSATLNLGALSHQVGGAATFTLPSSGSIQATGALSNGILGGWAMVGGSTTTAATGPKDWATLSGGNVVAYTGYTDVSGAPAIPVAAGSNVRWTTSTGNATVGAVGTNDINTFMFSEEAAAAARTLTVTGTLRFGAQGGIARTGSGNNMGITITGGTLTAGGADNTAGELVFAANQDITQNNNNNVITVASGVNNNGTGAVTVIKTGRGALALNGAGNYSGGTYVTDGRVTMGNAAAFGTGPVHILPGGHVFWNSGTNTNPYFISGLGSIENVGNFGAIRFNNAGALQGTVTLTGDSRLTSTNAGSTISGKITGNYNLEFGGDINTARSDTQVLAISNTGNDWNGTTTINRGTLKLGANEVIPHGVSAGNVVFDSSGAATAAGGAALDLAGRNETINGLSTTGANQTNSQIVNSVAGTATLTFGGTNVSGTFNGNLLDGTGVGKLAIRKTGTGTQTFTGVNFHTGGITVDDGTLVFTGGAAAAAGATNGNWANNNTLITVASSAGLVVGQRVTGTGVPANSYVTGILSGTQININNNLTPASPVLPATVALSFAAGGSALGTGPVSVASPGTLNISGVSGGASLVSGQTLTNNGNVIGGITAPSGSTIKGTGSFQNTISLSGSSATVGGSIAPGNSVGTLTADSVAVSGGGVLNFEISGATADKLMVSNTASLAGSGITVSVLSPATQPFFDIITAGTLASMPTLNNPIVGRTTFSLTNPDANTIRLNVTGGPASVRWTGTGGNPTQWESTQLDANWITSDAVADTTHYYDGDFVTLNDTDNGGTNYTVNVTSNVAPGSVTVNNSGGDYTIGGTGAITGLTGITKTGSRALTLTGPNTFSGPVAVSGGGSVSFSASANLGNAAASNTISLAGGSKLQSTGASVDLGATRTIALGAGGGQIDVTSANALTVSGAVSGAVGDSLTKTGTGTMTLSAASNFAGGLVVNGGGARLSNVGAAGGGAITVNSGSLVYVGVNPTNAVNLGGGTFGTTANLNPTTMNVTATAATSSTIRLADPQNLPVAAADVFEMAVTGNLNGSGDITVLSNGQDNNPDGGNGFRLRGTSSNYSGVLTIGNNVKAELQTTVAGPFSPAGTGKIRVSAGDANLTDLVTTVTTTGGYSTLNLRNNSTGNTVFGNDVEVIGTGMAVLNPLGTAPAGSTITMGNLKIGAGQEAVVYLGAEPNHPVVFTSVTLTGGNATFSPKKSGYSNAAPTNPSSDLVLGNISESAASSITMNGARTLYLTGTGGYSGTTTINNVVVGAFSGALQVGGIGGGSTGELGGGNVINNGSLVFFRTNAYAASNDISGTGSVDKRGGDVLTLSGNNSYAGKTGVLTGTLRVNGTHTGAGNYNVSAGATLGGTGTITPASGASINTDAGGIVAPGASIGTLTVDGSSAASTLLSLASGTLFSYELGAGHTSDKLAITNAAAGDVSFNNATINFSDLTSGSLASGDYTLFSADIASAYAGLTVNGSNEITAGLSIGTGLGSYANKVLKLSGNDIVLNIAAALLAGDYNDDKEVNAADYVVWKKNVGTNNLLPNDLVGGTIGDDQYKQWKENFGNVASGSGAGLSGAVPEPTSAMLCLFAAAGVALVARRRGRSRL